MNLKIEVDNSVNMFILSHAFLRTLSRRLGYDWDFDKLIVSADREVLRIFIKIRCLCWIHTLAKTTMWAMHPLSFARSAVVYSHSTLVDDEISHFLL